MFQKPLDDNGSNVLVYQHRPNDRGRSLSDENMGRG